MRVPPLCADAVCFSRPAILHLSMVRTTFWCRKTGNQRRNQRQTHCCGQPLHRHVTCYTLHFTYPTVSEKMTPRPRKAALSMSSGPARRERGEDPDAPHCLFAQTSTRSHRIAVEIVDNGNTGLSTFQATVSVVEVERRQSTKSGNHHSLRRISMNEAKADVSYRSRVL